MKKILSKILKNKNLNDKKIEVKEKPLVYKKKNADLFNAELMPSGFFDTYRKILFRPRQTIEQMKND